MNINIMIRERNTVKPEFMDTCEYRPPCELNRKLESKGQHVKPAIVQR